MSHPAKDFIQNDIAQIMEDDHWIQTGPRSWSRNLAPFPKKPDRWTLNKLNKKHARSQVWWMKIIHKIQSVKNLLKGS